MILVRGGEFCSDALMLSDLSLRRALSSPEVFMSCRDLLPYPAHSILMGLMATQKHP